MHTETASIINFLQTVYQRSDAASCARNQAQLYDYSVALLNWNNDHLRFAALRQHLDACIACSEAFSRVYALLTQKAAPTLVSIPHPDLSFLAPTQSLSQRIQQALSRLGDHLRLQLSADLLPALHPTLANSALRSAHNQPYGELLLQLDPPADLVERCPISVNVYRDNHDPALCLLEVTVAPPNRSWPDLAEIAVMLNIGSENRSQATDAFGIASFAKIAIQELPTIAIALDLE